MTVDGEPEEGNPRSLSFLGAAGWAFVVELVFLFAVAFAESLHEGAMGDVVTLTASRLVAYGAVVFAMLRVYAPESAIRTAVAARRPRVAHLLSGLVVGAALAPGASWLNDLVSRRYPASAEETAALEQLLAAPTLGKRALLVATLGIVLPVADELFFRGALFTPLEKRSGAAPVVLATAALDTLMLASVRGVPSMLICALAFGLLRAQARSVVPAAVARVAFFCVSLGAIALGRPEWDVPWKVALAAAGVAVLALALGSRVRAVASSASAR